MKENKNKIKKDLFNGVICKEGNRQTAGITFIALVITVIVLLILAGVTIANLTGENGLLGKASNAGEETRRKTAEEKINLKITTAQIKSYTENQTMPTLQYLADELDPEKDNEIEYVDITSRKETASLAKVIVENNESIFTKLKEYPYEFEIDSNLKLASIDSVKVASSEGITPSGTINITKNGEYDVTNYAVANVAVPTETEMRDCTMQISDSGIISVNGVENMKSFSIVKDEKYLDTTQNATYKLNLAIDETKDIYVMAIDGDMNLYKSNTITYTQRGTYVYNEGITNYTIKYGRFKSWWRYVKI